MFTYFSDLTSPETIFTLQWVPDLTQPNTIKLPQTDLT